MFLPRLIKRALLHINSVWGDNTMATAGKICNTRLMRYLSQTEAAALDEELFNEYKFSVDQLMELAGLSVANAIAKTFPAATHPCVLVVCGPGNNGGDGLVAARHMSLFGYNVSIYYPKRTPKPLYENLLTQCQKFGVEVLDIVPSEKGVYNNYHVVVDALFGFSFKPPVKHEMKNIMNLLIDTKLPVCSVDIPSGWNVDKGPPDTRALRPALIISLSAPKICVRPQFIENAKHYLGGRFLPPGIIEKYNLILPPYPCEEQVVQISC